ncbi:MAG: dUTP diphosphatase [Candidatus Falkowbacteria bacterium]|nr:dUTP diphosphatase [Candidatus Falkowbacteria bacterium]
MEKERGRLIVIDGTDGSGKTTQLKLLQEKLEAEGFGVAIADFPQYNQKSAGMVEEYLSGKYGSANEVTPYQASIFYAVDRYDASQQIRKWLDEGKIVLCNRYTSSNMAHQGGKVDNPLERKVFFNWLAELEHDILKIPRPDLCLVLRVSAEIAQQLAKDRGREDWSGKKRDIHEENLEHLKKAELVYCEIAESNHNYRLVNCTSEGSIMDREEIGFLIWIYVSQMLKAENVKKVPGFTGVADIITKNHRQAFSAVINQEEKKEDIVVEVINEIAEEPVKKIESQKVLVEKLKPEAKIPDRAHPNDAGYDLFASENYSIPPYGQVKINTGIKMAIPAGFAGLIWDKSGLAAQGLKTMGGVIDADYRGEIIVVAKNLTEDFFHITEGQKVAQIIIQEIGQVKMTESKIEDETDRKNGSFGSTGKF